MIQSMTAFARQPVQGSWGDACWEIRAVNHRYLEIYCKLPETLRELEAPIREKIQGRLYRGKIEVFLRAKTEGITTAELTLNDDLLEQLITLSGELSNRFPALLPPNVLEFLKWPGMIQVHDMDTQTLRLELLAGLDLALDEIEATRQREGGALLAYLQDHLNAIQLQITPLKTKISTIIEQQYQLWRDRFAEAKLNLDQHRLEQEMLFFSQKVDVTEELNRLQVHIEETRRLLAEGGVIGRRLDFLMQELNREANTLASKSVDPILSHAVVEIKVLIEQMREQIQNIE